MKKYTWILGICIAVTASCILPRHFGHPHGAPPGHAVKVGHVHGTACGHEFVHGAWVNISLPHAHGKRLGHKK